MAKVDWSNLEIVEEWTPVDPGDPQAMADEGRKLRLLVALMLKVHHREELEQSARIDKENSRIRRKAGIAA